MYCKKIKLHWEARITTNLGQLQNAIRSGVLGQREYSTPILFVN